MKLKNQILIALIISGLLPLAIAFLYAIWHSSRITNELSLKAAEERLEIATEKLSSYFNNRLVEIEMLSRNPQVRSMDFKAMRPYLMQNLEIKSQHYEKFIIGERDGSFYNTAGGNPHIQMLRTFNDKSPVAKPKSISKRDYWQHTVGTNTVNQHRLYISNPMISYTTEVKQIVATSSIHNSNGETVGLIGGSLPWKNIQNKIQQLEKYLEEDFSGQAKLALISKDGTYWYHWDADKVIHLARNKKGHFILGDNGEKQTIQSNIFDSSDLNIKNAATSIIGGNDALITVSNNNVTTHHIFRPVKSAGYILQLAIPDTVLSAPTLNLINILTAVFIASTFIAIGLTLIISKRLTNPLFNLTSSVENIKKGELCSVNVSSKTYEFNRLVKAYNKMVEIIKLREKSLSDSQERFSLAMQGANDGLWDWDILTNEVYYSPRWKQMLGYTDDELDNNFSTWEKLVHKDDLSSIKNSLNAYVKGESSSLNHELRMIHKDSHIVNILSRGFLTRDDSGKAVRMVGTNIDITAQKEYEYQLHELNSNLEKRVKNRTEELESLNKELLLALDNAENANQAKGNFLANMSHEIRTPMNGIIGLTELTLRTDLDIKQREYLNKLKSSADILLHIVNDILDFSKIEAGKLDIESISFNLLTAIENVISVFNVKAQEKNLKLILEIDDSVPKYVIGDKFRLNQVLSNLTSNAIKFTEEGSITIKVDNDKKTNYLHFSITDTGIGISEEIQNELFKSFTQADNTTSRRYGGTGLGLAISKHLIKMMKGTITLTSKENQGSCFDFNLYLPSDSSCSTDEQTPISDNRPESAQTLVGIKTLLVEDVLVNQLIAKEFFSQAGMLVSLASNGKEAVEMAMQTHYDLIIMDIQMPIMDGYQATRQIRELDQYNQVPIIAMTANVMEKDKRLTAESGMNGHISKPIDTSHVIKQLEEFYLH